MEEHLTRIILVHQTDDEEEPEMYTFDDPRSHRELVKAINTGAETASLLKRAVVRTRRRRGADNRRAYRSCSGPNQQWAISHYPADTVTVLECRPPVCLTPRQYDVLFGIHDGLGMRQIARRLGISARTGYTYLSELKERFAVQSTAQLIAHAMQQNMLPPTAESE